MYECQGGWSGVCCEVRDQFNFELDEFKLPVSHPEEDT